MICGRFRRSRMQKNFFLVPPWWPTYEGRGGGKGVGREGRGEGEERRGVEGRGWEGVTADSIENTYFDPLLQMSIRNAIYTK